MKRNGLLTVVLFGIVATIGGIEFFNLDRREEYTAGDQGSYYYQCRESSGLFGGRNFVSSKNLDGAEYESFYESTPLSGGMSYTDLGSDGSVDNLWIINKLRNGETKLNRTEHYSTRKEEFDEANVKFAKIREPYVARMKKFRTD